MSLGRSGGPGRACRVHLHIIQLGFKGKPMLRKMADFPSMHACGDGVDLPHLAKHAFGYQSRSRIPSSLGRSGGHPAPTARLHGRKISLLRAQCAKGHGVGLPPSSRTKKLRIFSKNRPFRAHRGAFLRFSRCWPCFAAGIFLNGSGCTRKVNPAWV